MVYKSNVIQLKVIQCVGVLVSQLNYFVVFLVTFILRFVICFLIHLFICKLIIGKFCFFVLNFWLCMYMCMCVCVSDFRLTRAIFKNTFTATSQHIYYVQPNTFLLYIICTYVIVIFLCCCFSFVTHSWLIFCILLVQVNGFWLWILLYY